MMVMAVMNTGGAAYADDGATRCVRASPPSQVDLTLQLDSLFRRSLHKLALDVARAHGADASVIASIQQR